MPAAAAPDPRILRAFCLAAAVLYPAWGLVCDALVPGSRNDLGGRLAVAALLLVVGGASYASPRVARSLEGWLAFGLAVLTAHYAYVTWLNGVSAFYVAGIFVTLGAIDACFQSLRPLVAFSAAAVLAALPLALLAPGGQVRLAPLGVVLLLGLLMQQGLFYLMLRARLALQAQLAHEVEARHARLLEIDRLKTELIASVSHELRTPLVAIVGYAGLLEEELAAGRPAQPHHPKFLARILESAHRLERQIEDLLDVARLAGGALRLEPAPLDLAALVEAAVEDRLAAALTKGVALGIRAEPGLPAVPADQERIYQVVANLVGNALKFTPPGGRVEVATAQAPGGVRVEVRDTGPGVAPADRERIFERFFQTEAGAARHHGGAGLGLAIAKGIVEAHGGAIGVEGTAGGGATFWFTLPAGPKESSR